MPREQLWRQIQAAVLFIATHHPHQATTLANELIRQLLQRDCDVLLDLVEHAAKQPNSNAYAVLYGLIRSRYCNQQWVQLGVPLHNRLLSATQVKPSELAALTGARPSTPSQQQFAKHILQGDRLAQVALKLPELANDHILRQLLFSAELRALWQTLLVEYEYSQPLIFDTDYYLRFPAEHRPRHRPAFEIIAGHTLESRGRCISDILDPIKDLAANRNVGEVLLEMQQEFAEICDGHLKRFQAEPLLNWQVFSAIYKDFLAHPRESASIITRLQAYEKDLRPRLLDYFTSAAKHYHNFRAINYLTHLCFDKLRCADQSQHSQQQVIQNILEYTELAKAYHGSLGFAFSAECCYKLAKLFKDRNSDEDNISAQRRLQALNQAVIDMGIAVKYQPLDHALMLSATLLGYQQNCIAFKTNAADTYQKRYESFVRKLKKVKHAQLGTDNYALRLRCI